MAVNQLYDNSYLKRMPQKVTRLFIKILWILNVVLCVQPAQYAFGPDITRIWRTACLVVNLMVCLSYSIRCKLNDRSLTFIIYTFVFYIVSCLHSQVQITQTIVANCIKCISFILMLEEALAFGGTSAMKTIKYGLNTMCFFNFISVIIFHGIVGGMRGEAILYGGRVISLSSDYYLLGTDNSTIFYVLPALALTWIYALRWNDGRLVGPLLFNVCMIAMYALTYSVVALATTFIYMVISLILWFKKDNIKTNVSIKKMYVWCGLIGLIICCSVIAFNSSVGMTYVADIFGKSIQTGRVGIWNASIKIIRENPLLGVGIEDSIMAYRRLAIDHCHNIVLEIMYCSGCIGATLLIIFFLKLCPKEEPNTISLTLACYGITILLMAATFDWYPSNPFPYLILYLPRFACEDVNNLLVE